MLKDIPSWATLDGKERIHANGLHATAHVQPLNDGLQGTLFKPMQVPNKDFLNQYQKQP